MTKCTRADNIVDTESGQESVSKHLRKRFCTFPHLEIMISQLQNKSMSPARAQVEIIYVGLTDMSVLERRDPKKGVLLLWKERVAVVQIDISRWYILYYP